MAKWHAIMAMFAVSNCINDIKKCRNGPASGNRVDSKRQQLFVSNVWWWLYSIQGWLQSLLTTFWMPWMNTEYLFVSLIVLIVTMVGTPRRKIEISHDHWRSNRTWGMYNYPIMLFKNRDTWINHAIHLNTYFDASNTSLNISVILWCIWSWVHRIYDTSPWHSTSQ